jgi:hypothetical protein
VADRISPVAEGAGKQMRERFAFGNNGRFICERPSRIVKCCAHEVDANQSCSERGRGGAHADLQLLVSLDGG